MIRTHIVPCQSSRAEADALNRESGRIYSQTLIWQYRIKRRKGIWLSPGASERLGDALSGTTLHAHCRDAAQQAFHRACKTAKANRHLGAKYPHKRKWYRTTVWKASGIRLKERCLLLARAQGLAPIAVPLPNQLADLPKPAFREARLVYDRVSRHYQWHLVVEDGTLPAHAPGDKTLAVDLGEIHPAAVANERGAVVIFTARDLRSLNQYRHKKLSTLQARLSQCAKRSRRWKRLRRRKVYLLARNNRQRRDIEHKVTRAVVNHAKAEGAGTVYVGDLREVGTGKRLRGNAQQQVSGWSHGRQIRYLAYKLAAQGIGLKDHSERYTSKTCPNCGRHNQSKGRNYRCAGCGFATARDANGAANFVSLVLFGAFGHVRPSKVMYRRVFRRSSPDTAQVAWGRPQEAAGL